MRFFSSWELLNYGFRWSLGGGEGTYLIRSMLQSGMTIIEFGWNLFESCHFVGESGTIVPESGPRLLDSGYILLKQAQDC